LARCDVVELLWEQLDFAGVIGARRLGEKKQAGGG
jgi:hypothetical protein